MLYEDAIDSVSILFSVLSPLLEMNKVRPQTWSELLSIPCFAQWAKSVWQSFCNSISILRSFHPKLVRSCNNLINPHQLLLCGWEEPTSYDLSGIQSRHPLICTARLLGRPSPPTPVPLDILSMWIRPNLISHWLVQGFLFLVLPVSQILAMSIPKPLPSASRPDSHADLRLGVCKLTW